MSNTLVRRLGSPLTAAPRTRHLAAFAASVAFASLFSLAGGASPTVLGASVAHTALINGDSVTTNDGITSGGTPISLEQYAAEQADFTVTVVTGAQWDAMTAAQFAQYQVLIIGDPYCNATPTSATSDAATWAPVVMGTSVSTAAGNRVVVGTDPEFHYVNGGAEPLQPPRVYRRPLGRSTWSKMASPTPEPSPGDRRLLRHQL